MNNMQCVSPVRVEQQRDHKITAIDFMKTKKFMRRISLSGEGYQQRLISDRKNPT